MGERSPLNGPHFLISRALIFIGYYSETVTTMVWNLPMIATVAIFEIGYQQMILTGYIKRAAQ
jgi:hypothetical protein